MLPVVGAQSNCFLQRRQGLNGTTYLKLDGPGASESRVGLTEAQAAPCIGFAAIAENPSTSGARACFAERLTSNQIPNRSPDLVLKGRHELG